MKRHLAILTILFLIPMAAYAGEPAAAPKAEPEKKPEAREEASPQGFRFAIVSELELFDNLEENLDIKADLELIQKQASEALRNLRKEYEALKSEVDLMAEGSKEREQKMKELEKKSNEYNQNLQKVTGNIQQQAKRRQDALRLKIREAVAGIARKEGYSLVFEKSSLLYGGEAKGLDITTEVNDQMNNEYIFKKTEGTKESPKDDKKGDAKDAKKEAPKSDKKDASEK
jgi:outer membrane protein